MENLVYCSEKEAIYGALEDDSGAFGQVSHTNIRSRLPDNHSQERVSPLRCLQELAPIDGHYPWRVMIVCILLNQTHGRQVRPMIDEFWSLVPGPGEMLTMCADKAELVRDLIRPLGFANRRMNALYRNASDYLDGLPLESCFGIGQYGRDAIDIFVHGRTDVRPTDKWLVPYLEWRRAGGKPVQWNSRVIA